MTKVLVIEDEQPIREAIVEMLLLAEYDVAQAPNGRIGVDLATAIKPDLIICDVTMPEMDGYEVLASLRAAPATSAIPFVFLTARAARDDVRKGMNLGAEDYLTKPFVAQELLETVEVRLKRQQDILSPIRSEMEEIRSYLSMAMPHELRTPLAVLSGYTDILKADFETLDPETAGEILTTMQRSIARLHRATENYIAHTQLEIITRDPQRIEELRDYATCRTTARDIRRVAERVSQRWGREGDLSIDVQDAPLRVYDNNLKKIVEEILDNAFKFSKAGDPVELSAGPDGSQYAIRIRSAGHGMTAEQIARIGPFNQFDRKTHEQQGLGLGLSIAKRLTDVYDGRFAIASIPHEETRVDIALPLLETPEMSA